jgi:hypothetical protein
MNFKEILFRFIIKMNNSPTINVPNNTPITPHLIPLGTSPKFEEDGFKLPPPVPPVRRQRSKTIDINSKFDFKPRIRSKSIEKETRVFPLLLSKK